MVGRVGMPLLKASKMGKCLTLPRGRRFSRRRRRCRDDCWGSAAKAEVVAELFALAALVLLEVVVVLVVVKPEGCAVWTDEIGGTAVTLSLPLA